MANFPCPLCQSSRRRPVWERESYPAVGGKVVDRGDYAAVPWLPLEISLCLDCHHIYQSSPPPAEVLDSFYTGSYVSSNASPLLGGIPPKGLAPFLQLIREATGPSRGRALEIGAYDGYFLHLLSEDGWDVRGYEPTGLGEMGKRTFGIDIRREFYRPGDTGERWDLVVSRYVFEHLSAPNEILEGVYGEMAPSGWLALEVPDMETRLREGVLGCFAHEHVSYFVPATLRHLVERAGFRLRHLAGSNDGLVLLAQKPSRAESAVRPDKATEKDATVPVLLSQHEERRRQKRSKFDRELASHAGPRRFVVYGADSHTADLLIEGWLPGDEVVGIVDDDPAKQGKYLACLPVPVADRSHLPAPMDALVVLSAFGHHDRLWQNLAPWRADGGAVMQFYPECHLVSSSKDLPGQEP